MVSSPIEENEESNAAGFAFWLRFWRWTIAASQIVGGLWGLYSVMFGQLLGPSRLFFLLAFVLFVASIWGGVLLALDRAGGVAVSLAVQTLQVLQIATPGLLYSFVSGMQLILGLHLLDNVPDTGGPDVGLSFFFPARFFVFINPPPSAVPQAAYTGVNVVAVLAIICLLIVRSARLPTPPPAPKAGPTMGSSWPPAPGL